MSDNSAKGIGFGFNKADADKEEQKSVGNTWHCAFSGSYRT